LSSGEDQEIPECGPVTGFARRFGRQALRPE
jgi:hypothetical protein